MTEVENFLKLLRKHPDLPVIPLVDSEVVADDSYQWWMGEFGRSELTSVYKGRERIHLKDDDDEDILNDLEGCAYGKDQYGRDIYELPDDEWARLLAMIPWKKAIVVYITA